jgi:hypothetical protein
MDRSFVAFYQAMENGNLVASAGLEGKYNGETLDVTGFQDDTTFYAQLDNQDIMDLLSRQANPMPLEEMIIEEYDEAPQPRSRKPSERKSSERKSSERKSSERKSAKSRRSSGSKKSTRKRSSK